MKSLGKVAKEIEKSLSASGIEEAVLDTRLLICHVLKLDHIDYALDKNQLLSENDRSKIINLVKLRLKRIPMSQIFGEKEFWSLTFKVTSDTLTPRPDSETLIEVTLANISDKAAPLRILDLGTGSGCLLLSLLSELPKATGLGTDISEKALDIACENSIALNLSSRSEFSISNWTKRLKPSEKFDIIICNPPYIGLNEKAQLSPEVKDHEPETALFSGSDGLGDYRKLSAQIGPHLKAEGKIILEIGYRQAADVKEIFTSSGFNNISLHKDLANRDRCLIMEI